ncbi:MAG: hypothetical protein V3T72_04605 [Thermoanaerobaculia bacterium]
MRRRSASPDPIGGEYAVVPLRPSWSTLSLLFFLLTLPAKSLLNVQPWRPDQIWMWPLVPPLVIAALSALGLAAGLLGLRFSATRGLAKTGVLLNAVVFGCILLVALGMMAILR